MRRERWAQPIAWAAVLLGLQTPALAEEPPTPVQAAPPAAQSPEPRAPARSTWGTGEPGPPAEEPKGEPPRATPSEPPAGPCAVCADDRRSLEAGTVRYTLESIEIEGNIRTSDRVVLRYVPFQAGDVLDVDDPEVELTRFRLLGTGFFREVEFSLRKGSHPGLVVLHISLVERNTIVINNLSMGLSKDADTQGAGRALTAYAGLDIAETNLGGTGMTLGAAAAFAQEQLALRVRYLDPAFLGGSWMTTSTLLYTDAQDYFGNADVRWSDPGNLSSARDYAVARYQRFGGSVGVGRDLSVTTQLWLHYRLEVVDADYPLQASHLRGFSREPIDFDVIRGRSILSAVRGVLQHDTRDHPFLPTRGWFTSVAAELALLPAALDYDYQRIELDAAHWWLLPWHRHVLKVSAYAGSIAGDAPFFEQFHVGDFSDFRPDRLLGINFDRRPPPNFLGTVIAEVRYGEHAFRLGAEYRVPLYRGHRSVYGIDLFGSGGLYGVASTRDLTDPPEGYSGAALIPVDLTANVGLRMDTAAGGFIFAFSNVLGLVPVHGQGPAGED